MPNQQCAVHDGLSIGLPSDTQLADAKALAQEINAIGVEGVLTQLHAVKTLVSTASIRQAVMPTLNASDNATTKPARQRKASNRPVCGATRVGNKGPCQYGKDGLCPWHPDSDSRFVTQTPAQPAQMPDSTPAQPELTQTHPQTTETITDTSQPAQTPANYPKPAKCAKCNAGSVMITAHRLPGGEIEIKCQACGKRHIDI